MIKGMKASSYKHKPSKHEHAKTRSRPQRLPFGKDLFRTTASAPCTVSIDVESTRACKEE